MNIRFNVLGDLMLFGDANKVLVCKRKDIEGLDIISLAKQCNIQDLKGLEKLINDYIRRSKK